MEINITLISTIRTILIWIIGITVIFVSAIVTSVYKDLQPFLFIGILFIGGLTIYFLLKIFSRFVDTVVVNADYVKVGEKYTIYWDSIKSYQYSNTGLLVGFVFRTDDATFRITGLLRGCNR